MKLWVWYALLTASLWGLWGFFGKMASRTLLSHNLLLISSLGSLISLLGYVLFFSKHFQFTWSNRDYLYGFLSGVTLILGIFVFYLALSHGEATSVVIITGTYPVITLVLAYFFLKEPLSFQKLLGVALALSGIILLSK